MTRTLLRRGGRLHKFVSVWVALAFVLSLTNVAYAVDPSAETSVPPAIEAPASVPEVESSAPDSEVPAEPEAPAVETPPVVEEPETEVAPEPEAEAEVPVASEPVTEPSVETEPVTASAVEEPERLQAAVILPLSHVDPVFVSGNPALGPNGFRINTGDLPESGTSEDYEFTFGSITIHITVSVYDTDAGQLFDFTSDYPIVQVVAKGGPDANVYNYDPAVLSDTGLHAPALESNGKYPELSHIDFYVPAPGEVTVYKYEDLDRDGVHDEGEPFLSGWDIQLRSEGEIVDSGTTDGGGSVVFDDVIPGSYTVTETLQDGWVVTTSPYPVPITVSSGEEEIVKIGNAQVSDLTVLKYLDLNANGVRDEGEPPISGVEIQLLKDGVVIDTQVTDGAGLVVFADLEPGEYQVDEVVPEGFFSTVDLPMDVTVVEGQDLEIRIGNAELPDLEVLKFHDIDLDGVRDEGEPVLAGWTFQLKQEGVVVYSAITNEMGIAVFTDVEPGAYDLVEVLQDSWFATTSLPIELNLAANVDQSVEVGNSLNVTKTFELFYPSLPAGATLFVEYSLDGGEPVMQELTALGDDGYGFEIEVVYNTTISGRWIVMLGEEIITLSEFGPEVLTEDLTNSFTYDSLASGLKYFDEDGDGVRDEGEPGLSGWTIELYRLVGEVPVLFATTVTGEGGAYAFAGLPPGTYMVQEVMQEGWIQTDSPEGTFVISGEVQMVQSLDFGNDTEVFAPFTDTEIVKTVDKTTAEPGELLTYTLTYRNIGDATIETVTITDDYDERYITPVDVGDGVVSGGTITWERFDLAPDEERTITYTMRIDEEMPEGTTRIENTAVINPFGDSDSAVVIVENPVEPEEEEPFLPFTGGELLLLVVAVFLAGTAGILFREVAKVRVR